MKEYQINYTDYKYSETELQVKVEFNNVERGTRTDEFGQEVGYIISSMPIQTVIFILPINFTNEQINSRLQTYLNTL